MRVVASTPTPERIVLTASTSEAYSLLFKLLCAPQGDAVMVPVPSYPLFDHLTALDGIAVDPVSARLSRPVDDRHRGSSPRLDASGPGCAGRQSEQSDGLGALGCGNRCARRTRAVSIVPRSSSTKSSATIRLEAGSRRSELAAEGTLTFRLGGLSKSAGLPQVKLGWILVDGPDDVAHEAAERLEVICDAYLSVSTPVQIAAPGLIAAGAAVRAQILERVRLELPRAP